MHRENFDFGDWRFTATSFKTILPSVDPCQTTKSVAERGISDLRCDYCKYTEELSNLPQWPEMIFPKNQFVIFYKPSSLSIDFNCLDALKLVDNKRDWVKVYASESGLRLDPSANISKIQPNPKIGHIVQITQITPTTQKIDLGKLTAREKLLFYQEIPFYEDELADNGCSCLTLKFRCMPSSFFCLLRFYLRVDRVLVKFNDTRLYWETGYNYLLREKSSRCKWFADMSQMEKDCYTNQNEIWRHLDPLEETVEKIEF